MGALVHAIRKLKGQFEDREAPASSQLQSCTASLLQAPVSRAERVAEQLEGSTLWHDYTASTDDEAFLGQGGQASAIRHVHSSIACSAEVAFPVIHCKAASPLVCYVSLHQQLVLHTLGCAAGSATTGRRRTMPSRCSRRGQGAWRVRAAKWQRYVIYKLCPTSCGTGSMASIRGRRGWSRREHALLSATCPARPVKWDPRLHAKQLQLVLGCTYWNAAVSAATHVIRYNLSGAAASALTCSS